MRKRIASVICLAGFLVFTLAPTARAQHPTPAVPQPRQSPNAPANQNAPQGLEGAPTSIEASRVSVDLENEKELRASVDRLYVMVSNLKNEVEKTNANMVLDVSLVKRAQEIEKLAKQIKDRAKR
ncbi:MAG TPA: hypothetical protein VNO32_27015 [Candidatus Acidoferrum sp.]|nr:hypothetical protein [Candidatus Acidoferrum sp.]